MIIDKVKADLLIANGFSCTPNRLSNGTETYIFVKTPELENYLYGNFSAQDFCISKHMKF